MKEFLKNRRIRRRRDENRVPVKKMRTNLVQTVTEVIEGERKCKLHKSSFSSKMHFKNDV